MFIMVAKLAVCPWRYVALCVSKHTYTPRLHLYSSNLLAKYSHLQLF